MPLQKNRTRYARDPKDIPLPPSPSKARIPKNKAKHDAQTQAASYNANRRGTSEDNDATDPWSWAYLTEPSISSYTPIFTKDGGYFFSIVGSSVRIHSAITGQVVSTLSASSAGSSATLNPVRDQHIDNITSIILNPTNPFQLITGSLDGCIKVWDFLDAVLLHTVDIGQPILHICGHERFPDRVFVAAARPTKKKTNSGIETEDNAIVLSVSLKPTSTSIDGRGRRPYDIEVAGKTRAPHGLALSPSGEWLVTIGGHKAYVARTSSLKAGFTKFVSPEALTCLAFHPSEEYFATGDAKGNIRLWYCLNEQSVKKAIGVEKRAQTTTFHWHAHSISSLAFTSNGAYLLSGGEEAVLVMWQLQSGRKEFVPRVGAPIASIAVCRGSDHEEEYLLGLADASYVFISSSSMKPSRTFSRIKLNPMLSSGLPPIASSAPLATHVPSSTLILPSSHPSYLQIYSPSTSNSIAELEISPTNRVSRRDSEHILPSTVDSAVAAHSGEWLATIDRREGDESFHGEIYLKFWRWDGRLSAWTVNTRVDRPHGLKRVVDMAFGPTGDHLVTAGEDGQVKSWRIRELEDKNGHPEVFWFHRSTFTFRSMTPLHVSWSHDGSVLAVTYNVCVALYDPSSTGLRGVITSSECRSLIKAHFVGQTGRYLVLVAVNDLVMWDVVCQTSVWHRRSSSPIDGIVTHPHRTQFAALHRLQSPNGTPWTKAAIFDASSANPIAHRKLPFQLRNVTWNNLSASSLSPRTSGFTLVGITSDWGVVVFGDDVHIEAKRAFDATIGFGSPGQVRTLFQDIFGAAAFTPDADPPSISDASSLEARWSSKEAVSLVDGPSYLMPPFQAIFNPLIDTLLRHRHDDVPVEERSHEQDEADDNSVEEWRLTSSSHVERFVDNDELDMLIALFRNHAIEEARLAVKPAHMANTVPRALDSKNRAPPIVVAVSRHGKAHGDGLEGSLPELRPETIRHSGYSPAAKKRKKP
ncbi:WD40 repeat-like protein [Punctularia strigosozonata HHB-11173 SS5]|uniref:WD40 repeat-like protein n=1 Tax=Punctularia strigosozonata (strain HHB-11173) TaxID=741275 RepID=UPI00044184EE|nr:WD40 repeat-like protein [Punctularia strigosozonata HHB-11173 SS5]EIN13954.1 WD40 repeat-like protein [Punctularia strigosozonata HHB-11173 SS5]